MGEPLYSSPQGRRLNLWKPSTQFSNGDPLCSPSGSIEHQRTNIWCVSSNGIPRHMQALCRALCWREAGPEQPWMAASSRVFCDGIVPLSPCRHRNLFYFPGKHLERCIDTFVPVPTSSGSLLADPGQVTWLPQTCLLVLKIATDSSSSLSQVLQ